MVERSCWTGTAFGSAPAAVAAESLSVPAASAISADSAPGLSWPTSAAERAVPAAFAAVFAESAPVAAASKAVEEVVLIEVLAWPRFADSAIPAACAAVSSG